MAALSLLTLFLAAACGEEGGARDNTGPPSINSVPQAASTLPPEARIVDSPDAIDRPGSAIVVIYNHGTERPQRREDCDAFHNSVPPSLRGLRMQRLHVYRLCSETLEDRDRPTGNYIYQRVDEIAEAIAQLNALGVTAERIFVAGHSAGGWSSLMAAIEHGDSFNGAIAFAPSFAGPRDEINVYPRWRQEARPRQIAHMKTAERMDALVFAYEGDQFNRPQELRFLTETWPDSVQLVGYDCNGPGHLTHLRDCQEAATRHMIATFIESELAEARPPGQ
ncbi:MAG: hypothetical protein TEF_10665 [Rhizobiales bacterium NRL2]|jgi:pimeloyl-ACP methyl ester carboxylesterase|nr:MAG: hypothetical protein TEF_10665 [Rhizobiales bacterium NRL2]